MSRWRLYDGIPVDVKPEVFYDIGLSTLQGPSGKVWYPDLNVPAVVSGSDSRRLWVCRDLTYPVLDTESGNTIIGSTLSCINLENDAPRIEYDIPIADHVGVAIAMSPDDIPILIVERSKDVR